MRVPSASAVERLPWAVRLLLGCCTAGLAVGLTYVIAPLRAFPLLLALPTVVLAAWFLGMTGAIGCALTDIVLVDRFLTRTQFRFSTGDVPQSMRLSIFLVISLLLGWAIRRLADQRTQLSNNELQRKLLLAEAKRLLAEERARASEALRDRDEVLQLALGANGMGLWVFEIEKGTFYRSDEVYRMVGREPGSFAPNHDEWLQFVHPDDVEGLNEAFAQARAEGRDYHKQYRVRWPDGSVHWLESQAKCQRAGEGRVTRIVGVIADVTHRKLAEEAMLRAEKLAVAGRLAASVAHEINNPLEAMANMLYLITMAETAESARKHASNALAELMRVSLITQSTLKFHRQTGSPKITRLSDVVGGVLELFRGKLQAMEILVEVQVENEVAIACMPSETQQIFANLVANAIEAMPRYGRLLIRLRSSRDWRNRNTEGMRVTVGDSGVGMDRATMRRAFEPFFTTKTDTGTGLGLWVVAQLVERHQGRVWVWSSQRSGSSGTVFSVFLPIGDTAAAEAIEEEPDIADAKGPQSEAPAVSARLLGKWKA